MFLEKFIILFQFPKNYNLSPHAQECEALKVPFSKHTPSIALYIDANWRRLPRVRTFHHQHTTNRTIQDEKSLVYRGSRIMMFMVHLRFESWVLSVCTFSSPCVSRLLTPKEETVVISS